MEAKRKTRHIVMIPSEASATGSRGQRNTTVLYKIHTPNTFTNIHNKKIYPVWKQVKVVLLPEATYNIIHITFCVFFSRYFPDRHQLQKQLFLRPLQGFPMDRWEKRIFSVFFAKNCFSHWVAVELLSPTVIGHAINSKSFHHLSQRRDGCETAWSSDTKHG